MNHLTKEKSTFTNISCLGLSILLALILSNCSGTSIVNEETKNQTDTYWILDQYFDSIFAGKQIAKYASDKICFQSVILHLEKDSFKLHGLVNWQYTQKINVGEDTMIVRNRFGTFKFFPANGKYLCIVDHQKDKIYTFDRVTDTGLLTILKSNQKSRFQAYMNEKIWKEFFSGKYVLQDKSSTVHESEFHKNNTLEHFRHYNKYLVHDYMGTCNPYHGLDAIVLIDTSANQTHLKKREVFNWQIKSDTIILRKFNLENDENYTLSKEIILLKKIAQR